MSFEFSTAESGATDLPYEPRLSFAEPAWRKLVLYTRRCQFEIGGLGLVERVGRDFVVRDVFVLQQDVNDIATRLDPASVHRLIVRLLEDETSDPSMLRLWWHSHAREEVFWSGEDEETIERFRNEGMLSVVTNHQFKVLARWDNYDPRRTAWVWVQRPEGNVDESVDERDEIDRVIADNVRHVPRRASRTF